MTLTIDLTPEIEARLQAAAARHGLPVEEYALRVLDLGISADALPMTGAEALAYWKREGVIGLFSDRPDSPEFARELRRLAETRGQDF